MNPVLALIIANSIWGAASPIFKYALTDIPPFTLAFVRFYFSGLLLLPFIKIGDLRKSTKKDWLEIAAASIFGLFINISFFFLALKKTDSINAPIIGSAGPLFLFIFAVIFLKEKPQKKVLSGMTIALIGALLIVFAPLLGSGKQMQLGAFEGNILLIIATLGAEIQPILLKNVLKRIDVITITAVSFLISSVPFGISMIPELRVWDFSQLHTAGWIGIIFGIVLSSIVGYSLYHWALAKMSAQETGIFTYIDPITAMVIAALLLHEYPDSTFIAGTLLIFIGIYLAEGRLPHWISHFMRK